MAASAGVARRYAEALFAAALDEGQVDAVERDLATLEQLSFEHPDLVEMMNNPLIPPERKVRSLNAIFLESMHSISLRFLQLLVQKRRSEVLPLIHDLFAEMVNEHRGILPAEVTSAVPLTPAEEQALIDKLSRMTGKTIVLRQQLRPQLLGGVRVRIQDTVIDGSVAGYLRQLRDTLRERLV